MPTSKSNSVYTSLAALRPVHRPQESLRERDNHQVVDKKYRADLLRGMPGPRGLEFWRPCRSQPQRSDLAGDLVKLEQRGPRRDGKVFAATTLSQKSSSRIQKWRYKLLNYPKLAFSFVQRTCLCGLRLRQEAETAWIGGLLEIENSQDTRRLFVERRRRRK